MSYQHALETLLWSSIVGPNDEPADNYEPSKELSNRIYKDWESFQEKAVKLGFNPELHRRAISSYELWDHAAHDFILTRNHHGAGFWDGDWFEPFGSLLTDLALTFPELELYLDDDGLVSAL